MTMRRLLMGLLDGYRYGISPFLGRACRFEPTCSEYATTAVERFGVMRGLWKAGFRLLKCHPFHAGGFDPVRE